MAIIMFCIVLIAAYIFQVLLGIIQIKHFNKVYGSLRRKGRVAIGKRSGKFRAGTIVLFAIKQDGSIIEGRYLQGITIMARFKELNELNGQNLLEVDVNKLKNKNSLLKKTIIDAIENYSRYMNGEEIPEKLSPLGKIDEKFKMIHKKMKKEVF